MEDALVKATEERDRKPDGWPMFEFSEHPEVQRLIQEAVDVECDRLRKQMRITLERYGRHLTGCSIFDDDMGCDCGFLDRTEPKP